MIKKRRFLLVLIFMLGFIALLLTTKRGLLLFNSIAILYLFFLVNLGRSKKNKKAIVISLILLVTISVFSAAIYLISNPSIATKILVDDDITSGRIGIYLLVFELIKKAPFIGNGLSSVEEFVGIKAHNIYLQLWAELGIAGLFLYTTAMLFTLKKTIQTYSIVNYVKIEKLKILVLVSIYIQIVFILYGFTGNGLYDYFMIGTYMIAIALPGSANLILTKLRY